MPNIKSAKKRVRVTETKTLQNKMFKTQMKTDVKKYRAAVAANDMAAAQELYKVACKKIDVAAAKGIIHTRTAPHTRRASSPRHSTPCRRKTGSGRIHKDFPQTYAGGKSFSCRFYLPKWARARLFYVI